MAIYNYLNVTLTEQSERSLTTIYTYPKGVDIADLAGTLPTPGQSLDYFLNARKCYVQWTTRKANCFSMIFRNPFASANGYYMITIAVAAPAALSGRELVKAFEMLRKTMVEEKQLSDDAVEKALRSAGVPEKMRSFDSWRISPDFQPHTDKPACYRTYVSTQELENCFTFPRQQEYDEYSRVIYVEATTSLRPGVKLMHVIKPIKSTFTIETCEGVSASRPAAAAGDRVMLTYTHPGYSPWRETVVVGRPSAFVTYDGAVMRVKKAADCRIDFVRRIPLTVSSAKGGAVTGYTVTVNGHPVSTLEPVVEISRREIESGGNITIMVSSTNYEVEKIERKAEDLVPEQPLEVVLRPIEQGVTLRLDFGGGRIFEFVLSLEKNTPEYSQLHAGQFHGFRAHRLTVPGRGEIYNVDVRAAAKPVAPVFTNISTEKHQQPAESKDSEPKINEEQQAAAAVPGAHSTAAEENSRIIRERRRTNTLGLICGSILLIAVIACAAVYFLPSWMGMKVISDLTNTPVDTTTILTTTDTVTLIPEPVVDEPAPEMPVADSQTDRDIAYLNSTNVWVRDSLKTDEMRSLIDAFKGEDIAAIAGNIYFTSGKCTNNDAIRMIDLLWAAKGTPTERSNVKCMNRAVADNTIDVHALYEDAARYRPAQINPDPRP